MPCIEGLQVRIFWQIAITCPAHVLSLATGIFKVWIVFVGKLQEIVESKDSTQRCYRYVTETALSAGKIGLCVGEIHCAVSQDHPQVFYFAFTKKALDHIENCLIPSHIVKEVVDTALIVSVGHRGVRVLLWREDAGRAEDRFRPKRQRQLANGLSSHCKTRRTPHPRRKAPPPPQRHRISL